MSILPFSLKLATQLFESQNKFPVNFDDAYQWLGYTRKDNARRSFLGFNFVENIDYVIILTNEENSEPDQRGRPSESILLTTDCFKTWGMMAQTEQGKQIRLYFLECERIAKEKTEAKSEIELLHELTGRMVQQERINKEQAKLNAELIARTRTTETKIESHSDRIIGLEAEVERHVCGSTQWYSIVAFAVIVGVKVSIPDAIKLGKLASRISKLNGTVPQKVRDPRFGLVNIYLEDVLDSLPWQQYAR